MSDVEKAVFKIHIDGSIEEVWREITKTDELQGAIFNMRLHTNGLRPGGQIRMRTANAKYTGVVGEILEFEPPHRFSHTMRFTQYDDPPCTVHYELREVAGGVEFTLTCENMPAGAKSTKQMKRGGTFIVKTLKAIVENGKPPFGTRVLYGFFKLTEPFSPQKTRSERWPLDRVA